MTSEYLEGTRGPFRNLVDYILGITHEIWESRQVDRIRDYYAPDTLIYTLGGLVNGAEAVVTNTRDTLAAFPDRLLLGDAVVWRRESPGVFYSSHRIGSPMTNLGASSFGPATGRAVFVRTIADCLVENGVITREWLVRDNFSLVQQLGLDVHAVAKRQAAQPLSAEHAAWLASERQRVLQSRVSSTVAVAEFAANKVEAFALAVLDTVWRTGDQSLLARHYAPYAVLHDSRAVASGLKALADHFGKLRSMLGDAAVSVDHCCVIPDGVDGYQVAVRWMLAGEHRGDAWGLAPTRSPVSILGVTHWQVVAGRIAAEWTIFDRLAVLANLYRAAS